MSQYPLPAQQAEYSLLCPKERKVIFNPLQKFIYSRALKGLKVYEKDEVIQLPERERKAIVINTIRCHRVLNVYKQRVLNHITNEFFQRYFPDSKVAKIFYISNANYTTSKIKLDISFQDLDITKQDIAHVLFVKKVLPKDFYDLQYNERPDLSKL